MPEFVDVILPADESEGASNTVGKWFKAVGDQVEINAPLLEITTDKVTVEIAAPAAGVLVEILKQEGESVEKGERLGRIEPGAAAAGRAAESVPPPPVQATIPASEPELSPAVRRLIQQRGLEAPKIKGTGRGGRITLQDVESHPAGGGARCGPARGPAAA